MGYFGSVRWKQSDKVLILWDIGIAELPVPGRLTLCLDFMGLYAVQKTVVYPRLYGGRMSQLKLPFV